ncbi:hypothetical protein Fmac_010163 [Flemingia macrophylla]|uniref:GATA-type domain-containing protein n=1 Tax=Flemingia macrophylla TaxID=520843 RepID=A0ABD1N290_9FABA
MDLEETNEAPNSKVHDFDLNIPCVEQFDAENEFSFPTVINNKEASIENTKIEENANHGKNEVHQPTEEDPIIQANNSTTEQATFEETREVAPGYIASVHYAPALISQRGRRHRRRRSREVKQNTDPDRFCTNFNCKTRKSPLWRKGPLGPKTLCNACGLQYIKTVSGRGIDEFPNEGDASTAEPVPSETIEGDSNL